MFFVFGNFTIFAPSYIAIAFARGPANPKDGPALIDLYNYINNFFS